MKSKVFCVIMGGGRGTRLYPLTKARCKPAVPLAGQYRLVDIPISNCLNSGYNRIYLLTQFNTASLHRHIQEAYKFDPFGGGFVDILSAEQTEDGDKWYQGTADAVRRNMHHFSAMDEDYFVILSGDQLYRMDLQDLVSQHKESGADVTVAATLVTQAQASSFGVMRVSEDQRIQEFVEKPGKDVDLEPLRAPKAWSKRYKRLEKEPCCLASMGIYVFSARVMHEALAGDEMDFGNEIIPGLLNSVKLNSYIFDGYWEDIGTVRAFFDANLMLTDVVPAYNFYGSDHRVYTRALYLPPSKVNSAQVERTMLADGCIIHGAKLKQSVISVRSVVREGSSLENVYMMGADYFEDELKRVERKTAHLPALGVGKNCRIENAILDKNVRIGDNVILSPKGKPDHFCQGDVYVRDGVLIVTKNGVVPSGTVV